VAAKESLKLIALVRFQLSHPFYCPIAQLAEQETVNFKVARSSRAGTANLYGSQATVDGHSTLNRTIRVGSTPTASTNFKQEEAVKVSMDITRC